jgi:hypothetical protein
MANKIIYFKQPYSNFICNCITKAYTLYQSCKYTSKPYSLKKGNAAFILLLPM